MLSRLVSSRRYATLVLVLASTAVGVAAIAHVTRDRILNNERAWFAARLDALIPSERHDNDLYADSIAVIAPDQLGATAAVTIYRARLKEQPAAAVLMATAQDGYGGPIDLLIAVDYEGVLLGVDVLRHAETAGIGDGFLPERSNWLHHLLGHSLGTTDAKRWTIRKDGGEFDQFTGASVTPRAILKATRLALEYYAAHRDSIFNEHTSSKL